MYPTKSDKSLTQMATSSLIVQLGAILAGVFLQILSARVLGAPARGVVELLLATGTLACLLGGLNLNSALQYYAAKNNSRPSNALNLTIISATSQIILAITICYLSDSIRNIGVSNVLIASICVCLFVLFNAFSSSVYAIFNGLGRLSVARLGELYAKIGSIVFLIFLGFLGHARVPDYSIFIYVILLALIPAIVAILYMLRSQKLMLSNSSIPWRFTLRYASWIYLVSVLQYLMGRILFFEVDGTLGHAAVGNLSVALTITGQLQLPVATLGLALIADLPSRPDEDAGARVSTVCRLLSLMLALITLGLWIILQVFGSFISRILGPGYDQVLCLSTILCLSVIPQALCGVLIAGLVGKGQPKSIVLPLFISLVVLILGFKLVPLFHDVTDSAIWWTVAHIIQACWLLIIGSKLLAIPFRDFLVPQRGDLTVIVGILSKAFFKFKNSLSRTVK